MKLSLLRYKILDFSSGSALEYHKGILYVIGDDVNMILCLDENWSEVKRIELFPFEIRRIPKPEKPDLECAAIVDNILYVLGSGSVSPQRDIAFIINLQDDSVKRTSTTAFYNLFRDRHLLQEMNIEAFTDCKDKILFFNRANTTQPNHLLITDRKILTKRFPDRFKVTPVEIPSLNGVPLGISGAGYDAKTDTLLITASAENTSNAYDDGEVMGSVLGIVASASKKIDDLVFKIENVIGLDTIDPAFSGQKIESVCVTKAGQNNYTLVLVADNDDGHSVLFEVLLEL